MNCTLCTTPYDRGERRPKVLPCGHSLCFICCDKLADTGEFACPFCNSVGHFNEVTEIPDNQAMLDSLPEPLHCYLHSQALATSMCATHFKPYCDSPDHHITDCNLRPIAGNEKEVSFLLLQHIAELYARIPEDHLNPLVAEQFRSRFKLEFRDLIRLSEGLQLILAHQSCFMCSSTACKYVDFQALAMYCEPCYHKLTIKVDCDSLHIAEYAVGNEEGLRESILSSVSDRLTRIHFYYLSLSDYDFFWNPPEDFFKLFGAARSIADLEQLPKLDIEHYPQYFPCPHCKTIIYKSNIDMIWMKCRQADHAICQKCAQSMVTSGTIICPLDSRAFQINTLDKLEVLKHQEECGVTQKDDFAQEEVKQEEPPERSNFQVCPAETTLPHDKSMRNKRRVIAGDHKISELGTNIPPFQANERISAYVPKEKLTALNRYRMVIPPITGLPAEYEGEAFTSPWKINHFPNQVEPLSFCSFRKTNLWGVGIANPITPRYKGLVEWIRIYPSDHAEGDLFTQCELLQNELVGGQTVLTDIYFTRPYSLPYMEVVTVKVKLGRPSTDPQGELDIFHGNHIGRYEEEIGDDETMFEMVQTYCVDVGEKNSGQIHFIGPILRLIYELQDPANRASQ